MRLLHLVVSLASATVLPLVVVPQVAADPPRLDQAACDTVATFPHSSCEQARITFSLDPASWPICSFQLVPAGNSVIFSCTAPPGWLCEAPTAPFQGAIWRRDPSVGPCPFPPEARVDNFQFIASSPPVVCLLPECEGCPGNPPASAFAATYFDSTGAPIFSTIPFTVMCEIVPTPALRSTWGSLKAIYR